jgi:uncharacterized cupredoxin-like copper-binding protein
VRSTILTAAAVGLVVAGCAGDEGAEPLDVPTSPKLEVVATEMKYTPNELAVSAGTVQVVLVNDGSAYHDLRIGEERFILEAPAGQRAESSISLEAGTYQLYCSIPGHSEAGMEGTLEVRAG